MSGFPKTLKHAASCSKVWRQGQCDCGAFQAVIARRRATRMDQIDHLPPALRELVHEYGWSVVDSFLALGIRDPKHIRHLVERVLDEFSPTRGQGSSQGGMSGRAKRAMTAAWAKANPE